MTKKTYSFTEHSEDKKSVDVQGDGNINGLDTTFPNDNTQCQNGFSNSTAQAPDACKPPALGYRHVAVVVGFLSFFLINVQRMSLGVAIVAMVNYTSNDHLEPNSTMTVCPFPNSSSNSSNQKVDGEFMWSSQEQGVVLGAGFLGFFLATVPSSKLAQTYQARRTALYGGLLTTLMSILSPVAARSHVYLMIAAQFVRGLGQGCLYVSVFGLMGNWFPHEERGLLSTAVISGLSLGSTVSSAFTGYICDIPSLGWAGVFYIVGIFGIFHALIIILVLYESPFHHPRISEPERIYITKSLGSTKSSNTQTTPWGKIFTSGPFYAVLIGVLGQFWTFSYFWTVHSVFLGTVQHFPIRENGYWSCLPFLMKACAEYITSPIVTWLQKKKYASVDVLRKVCNTLGCIGVSASTFGTYLSGCNGPMSAMTASIASFFLGVATPGAMITCIDMAPRFSGTLCALLNGAGCSMSFIVPILVGMLTKDKTLEEYHLVFFVSILVVMSCGIVFAVFGSAKVQSWNFEDGEGEDDKGIYVIECDKETSQQTTDSTKSQS